MNELITTIICLYLNRVGFHVKQEFPHIEVRLNMIFKRSLEVLFHM